MTKNQFLSIVDDINDKFIEEIADVPEQPQIIYQHREHFSVRRIAVSAAAVCVISAGIFAAVKLYGTRIVVPNDSDVSASSSITESNSEPISEEPDFHDREGDIGEFEITLFTDKNSPVYTGAVVKKDDKQYATVEIECRGVFSLAVYREGETRECIGRLAGIQDGAQTLRVDYNKQAEIGDEFVLCVWGEKSARISGKWIP